MASSALARYEKLLISNASTINTIESSVRSLTWFLPGRFKDAELASEALSATMNIMSMYHDTLLARRLKDPKLKPLIPPSPHARYTRTWADKNQTYRWAARALELIKFVELLVEMAMRRKLSRKGVWRGIVLMETIKAALKLLILKLTRRPLLSPPIPERDIDPASLPEPAPASPPTEKDQKQLASPPHTPAHLKNNRVKLPSTSRSRTPSPLLTATPPPPHLSQAAIDEYLLPKALSVADVRPALALMKPFQTPIEWISEVIHILRPLIYVLALQRAARQRNPTNSPLLISLGLDLLSGYLRRSPPATSSSSLERQEYAKRDRDILWYFLRGGIWSEWTRPKIEAIANTTSKAPIVGVIGSLIQDWIPLIDEYHYYTAA
ncbi:Peroxisomal membrane protein pex16 [Tulasnella sp. 419]|nr:Peroxisomal membrane protein pex16 [Tulasnella sp. 418]KAG8955803.1 Peroxisomal membrane protein pex16 [Tulasnella sp. 419]